MKRLAVVIVAVLFLLTMVPVSGARAQEVTGLPDGVKKAKISSYVDGDKIKVTLGGKRLELNFIGADAPEPRECYVAESNAAMKKLLSKGTVLYLETDATPVDSKGRLLRHVWAEGKGGKAFLVNAKLIRDGNAGWKAGDREDGNAKYADRYKKAEKDAKKAKNGLWAECDRLHSKARTKSQQRADPKAAEENPDSDGDGIADDVENQPDADEPADEPVDDYLTDLRADQAGLIQSFVELDAFIANPSSDTEAFFNVIAVLVTWQVTYEAWQGRDAAPGYEDVHAEWQLGLSLLNTAADQMTEGIDNDDQDRINEGVLNYFTGRSLVEGLSGRI